MKRKRRWLRTDRQPWPVTVACRVTNDEREQLKQIGRGSYSAALREAISQYLKSEKQPERV